MMCMLSLVNASYVCLRRKALEIYTAVDAFVTRGKQMKKATLQKSLHENNPCSPGTSTQLA